MDLRKIYRLSGWLCLMAAIALTACQPQVDLSSLDAESDQAAETLTPPAESIESLITPYPTRPIYQPGELVDYVAQTGDTLFALAQHFNTHVDEILKANSFIPENATTLPPGMPMKIPIYYAPFWGSQFKILPDSLLINGPAQVGFDTTEEIRQHPGWLNGYSEYASGEQRTSAQLINLVAKNFSVSPRLLLALVEYQAGGLSRSASREEIGDYPLGYPDWQHKGLYMQLIWAANRLNNGYYLWRSGQLATFELRNGRVERPDPWQNAASVALQYYFSVIYPADRYAQAIGPDGFFSTYASLYDDPWENPMPHIPGSLVQPVLTLPFDAGTEWAFTGGPHTGWGNGEPLAALDFAPGSSVGGCTPTDEWATAVAPGVVVRSEPGIVVLDLDGDGDERTGWVIFYLHLATEGRAPVGRVLKTGDPLGKPSCEGGQATGTHVHIARKYNGEWILADGPLPFELDGWVAHNGPVEYLGTLTRHSQIITACTCSDQGSQIFADPK